MSTPLRVPYTQVAVPFPTPRPILTIKLANAVASLTADALVDSGSDTNVLPWDPGVRLGCDWSRAIPLPPISGSLSTTPTRAVLLAMTVATSPPVSLAFAWVQSNAVRLILGQTNFFLEFDVCFHATRGEFTVAPRIP